MDNEPLWLPPTTERRSSLAISALLGSPQQAPRSRPQTGTGTGTGTGAGAGGASSIPNLSLVPELPAPGVYPPQPYGYVQSQSQSQSQGDSQRNDNQAQGQGAESMKVEQNGQIPQDAGAVGAGLEGKADATGVRPVSGGSQA
jgi:hypothetical protein